MKKTGLVGFALILAVVFPSAAMGLPSSADGNLSDWGVTRSGGEWLCDEGVNYKVENSTRLRSGSGVINQQFDAEGMAAFYNEEDGMLYVAVVTGTPPGGAVYEGNTYAPGDLAIDFNGDGIYEFGIETTGNSQFSRGTVVSTSSGDWSVSGTESVPVSIVGGSDVGQIAIEYGNNGGAYGKHYAIEMAIPVETFGSMWGEPFELTWTMESARDMISISNPGNGNEAPPIPEPATLLLIGAGLLGVAAARKRG